MGIHRGGYHQAIHEIHKEDTKTGRPKRARTERQKLVIYKAREMADAFYVSLLKMKWEQEIAEAGAIMVRRNNIDAELYEMECILVDERNQRLQDKYEALEDNAYRDDDYQTAREMEGRQQESLRILDVYDPWEKAYGY